MIRLWLVTLVLCGGPSCRAAETLMPRASASGNATVDGGAGRAEHSVEEDGAAVARASVAGASVDKEAPGAPDHARVESAARPKQTLIGQLNLNTAGIDELVLLPGIGDAKALRIVEWRVANALHVPIAAFFRAGGPTGRCFASRGTVLASRRWTSAGAMPDRPRPSPGFPRVTAR